jgi:hypothetical protein
MAEPGSTATLLQRIFQEHGTATIDPIADAQVFFIPLEDAGFLLSLTSGHSNQSDQANVEDIKVDRYRKTAKKTLKGANWGLNDMNDNQLSNI